MSNDGLVSRTLGVKPSSQAREEATRLAEALRFQEARAGALESNVRAQQRADSERKDGARQHLRQVVVQLAALSAAPVSIGGGYGLLFDPALSTPGVVVSVSTGQSSGLIAPGWKTNVPFDQAVLTFVSGSPTVGQAVFWLGTQPDVDLSVEYVGSSGEGQARIAGPYSAANNSTANVPSVVTDGIDITGCKGVRAIMKCNAAETLTTAGTGIWWLWDPSEAAWYESEVQTTMVTGRNRFCTADQVITVSSGRAFFEPRSFVSSGANAIQVWLRSF